jgi:hypothetical protein
MSGREPRRAAAAQVGLFGVVWVKNADDLPHGILGPDAMGSIEMKNGHRPSLGVNAPSQNLFRNAGRLYQPKAGTIA